MLKKSRKLYFTAGLLILILSGIIFCYNTMPVAKCMLVRTAEFYKIEQNIFCSPSSPQSVQDSLKFFVEQAKIRNDDFWEKPTRSDFTIIFCCTKAEMKKYAGSENYHTISFITPIGTYIVIDSTGLNPDILSHEINHSVLAKTIGYRAYTKLPVWFVEGIALQLDNRELMTDSILQKSYETNFALLNSISNYTMFHNKDWEITRSNYLISRYEVGNWINAYGLNQLFALLEAVKNGEEFKDYYYFQQWDSNT